MVVLDGLRYGELTLLVGLAPRLVAAEAKLMAVEAQRIARALPSVPKEASFMGIKAPLKVIRESLMSNPVAMMLNQNQITLTPGKINGSRVIDGSELMPRDLH